MPKGECPHCGQQLGEHYHSPKTGKDVCCLKCSKQSSEQFKADQTSTDPKFMKNEKNHASWPKDKPWPWPAFDVHANNMWVESKSGAPALPVKTQAPAKVQPPSKEVPKAKDATPKPSAPSKKDGNTDVKKVEPKK